MNLKTTTILAALAATGSIAAAGEPALILEDGNSLAAFDSLGQFAWEVDGTENLFEQSFFYRRDGFNDEASISTLDLVDTVLSDTNPFTDDRDDAIAQLWTDGSLEIETLFTLRGGLAGSGESGLAEQITITNTTQDRISFTFFQYVDFDLGGDFSDDSGQIVDGNIAQQSDDEFTLSETVVTPMPDAFQMDDQSVLSEYWDNGMIDNLNGNDSHEGDVAWAFQWDITLEAGQSFLISKNKSIVPAPGAMALLGLGGLAAARRRRA